ncbi:MAG TPA: rod-binding protein [Bacillota bacterium]|nr:rod-binding protein [Bacillota bacterium]HOR86606.1 rod-binding protein [Bacillota bacterium]HPL54115.1 rod-binding protein [Bacillota bacterium]
MVNPINNLNAVDYTNIKGKFQEARQGEFERALEKAIEEKDEEKLKQTCRDLESLFVSMMFKQMRNTVQKSDLFRGGFAEDMYEDMLLDKYAEEVSKGNGTGLGDILYRQLSKNIKKESEENNVK